MVTNKETKEYRPKEVKAVRKTEPEIIQNFGDSYSIYQVVKGVPFLKTIQNMSVNFDTLISLVCYKIVKSSAMQ